ncbi:MAG: acyl-CoA dehydrogenase family protein [Kofleriaceae bacterium]
MEFQATEEQDAVRKIAREFAERVLIPNAAKRDESGEFPVEEMRELGKLGLLAISVPEDVGGSEMGTVAYSLAIQEIARGDGSVAVAMSVTNMVGELIATNGTREQALYWCPKIASGEMIAGAFALSEPDAGSDPAAMRTTAVRTANGWLINGAKQWITSGDRAGVMILWAVTDPSAGHKGISCFIVPGDKARVARLEDKLGLRASSTAQLVFENVELPADAMLGAPGRGFAMAMQALDGGRIGISSQAIGIARGALEAAITYAGERKTFGQAIIKHQAIGSMLADAATSLDAANLMALRAAWLKESKLPFSQQAAMAKLFATERAWQICDIALQVHGGYGYVKDFPIERALRDVRATRIYEGTSEVQRMVISRGLSR